MEKRAYPPVRRRRRRRRDYRPVIVLLVLVLAGLVIWAVHHGQTETPPETEPQTTGQSQTAPKNTEPEATEPEPTEPPEPTAEEIIADFAAQHGLSLSDYPEALVELLKRNPETEEFVLNYPLEYGKTEEIDISDQISETGVPLFLQWDRRWGYHDYVGSIGGLSGCGPTCMAMAVFHFTRDPAMTPAYMMDFAASNRQFANELTATQWAFFTEGATQLGLTSKELTSEEIASESRIAAMLEDGKVIVANVGPGVFTEKGHYLLLVGYEDGKFRINDPNSQINSEKLWDFSEFSDQIKMMWALSK